ncbi:Uncharacterised protein [Bordetella pertussis]|nr:Uncharacterised protein [Bordetella pertussis]CFO66408.1 Uncharacterised protein [Bordetella pertussis]CFU81805.1 Uncharacterised protein [Bordetella pertussis]CPI25299.1 Uncharacterised protein [Bordetella pertussis]CPK82697.1 Uncharacterised protein [Bordetella pertussis]
MKSTVAVPVLTATLLPERSLAALMLSFFSLTRMARPLS